MKKTIIKTNKIKMGLCALLVAMVGAAALMLAPKQAAKTASAAETDTICAISIPTNLTVYFTTPYTSGGGIGSPNQTTMASLYSMLNGYCKLEVVFTDSTVYRCTFPVLFVAVGDIFQTSVVNNWAMAYTFEKFSFEVLLPNVNIAEFRILRVFTDNASVAHDCYFTMSVSPTVAYTPTNAALPFSVSYIDAPTYPLPPEPELEHHTFAGWYLDAAFTQPYDGRPIYQNTELYAKFLPVVYMISFETGVTGITLSGKAVTALTAVGALSPLSRAGYTFTGWYTDAARTQGYEPIMSMAENITLYAGWEQIILTVTFYVNGAVYMVIPVPYGSTLAQAMSAAQTDTAILSGVYSDAQLHSALSVNTVLTTDISVHAELGAGLEEKTGFFRRVGNWFSQNWPYFPVSAGCVGIGAFVLFIIQKKKGVI